MIKTIVSGGQTGSDQAAWDAAIFTGIAQDGWVPKGSYSEAGKINSVTYKFKETASSGYLERTALNVKESDATLLFSYGKPTGGTLRTIEYCTEYNKPFLYIDLKKYKTIKPIIKWLKEVKPTVLNIAGSRESKFPGIYKVTRLIIIDVLMEYNGLS